MLPKTKESAAVGSRKKGRDDKGGPTAAEQTEN
jgi:hypothetical protein